MLRRDSSPRAATRARCRCATYFTDAHSEINLLPEILRKLVHGNRGCVLNASHSAEYHKGQRRQYRTPRPRADPRQQLQLAFAASTTTGGHGQITR